MRPRRGQSPTSLIIFNLSQIKFINKEKTTNNGIGDLGAVSPNPAENPD